MAETMPDSIAKHRVDDLDAMTADVLLLDDLPGDTVALARILDTAAAGSTAVLEFSESVRRASDWKEVFQALGFRVLKMGRVSGRLRAILYKPVHPASLRKWSVILPNTGEGTTFERLYEWIAFFQRFDSIGDAEIVLVEDTPLHGNVSMMASIAGEGFFLRRRHYRPRGILRAFATGVHFCSGRKVILDGNRSVPASETLALLEASYPLDRDRMLYLVRGDAVPPVTDLRARRSLAFARFREGLKSGPESVLQFALLTADAARAMIPALSARSGVKMGISGMKTVRTPVTSRAAKPET